MVQRAHVEDLRDGARGHSCRHRRAKSGDRHGLRQRGKHWSTTEARRPQRKPPENFEKIAVSHSVAFTPCSPCLRGWSLLPYVQHKNKSPGEAGAWRSW